jgi:hypothetical protein
MDIVMDIVKIIVMLVAAGAMIGVPALLVWLMWGE